MTQSAGGYEPPRHQPDQTSTPQVAKDEAAGLARTAADSGGQVGQTAGEQARRVAAETTRQARNLMREGQGQLADQARQGQRKAAGGLHALADQLDEMCEKSNGSGLAPEVVRQASERTRGMASWLEEREPGALLDELRAFARRKPGVFLAGAAMAGVLVGRLTRGTIEAAKDDHEATGRTNGDGMPTPDYSTPPGTTGYSTPPTPAGYSAPAGPAGYPAAPAPGGYPTPPGPTGYPRAPEPEPWPGTADPRTGPVTR